MAFPFLFIVYSFFLVCTSKETDKRCLDTRSLDNKILHDYLLEFSLLPSEILYFVKKTLSCKISVMIQLNVTLRGFSSIPHIIKGFNKLVFLCNLLCTLCNLLFTNCLFFFVKILRSPISYCPSPYNVNPYKINDTFHNIPRLHSYGSFVTSHPPRQKVHDVTHDSNTNSVSRSRSDLPDEIYLRTT